jgi:phosphatidylglycerophosphate synthase
MEWLKNRIKNLMIRLMGEKRFEWLKYHSSDIVTWAHLVIALAIVTFIAYRGLNDLSFLHYSVAALWLAGAMLDILDGKLARKYKVKPGETVPSDGGFGAALDEKIDKVASSVAFVVLAFFAQVSWYFVIIMICRDVWVSLIRKYNPSVRSAKGLGKAKTALQNITIVAALLPEFPQKSLIVFFLIVISTTLSLASAMGYLLLAMNAKDNKWLNGTKGRIGAPNWWSITRLSLAPTIPYIFVMRPFDEYSYAVGTFAMLAVMLTDAVDGYLARSRNQQTEAGKMLDPLCDKVIFYLSLIGLFFATGGTFMTPYYDIITVKVFVIFFVVSIIAHDILFVGAYALYVRKFEVKMKSNNWDRIRFFISCAWLIAMSFALTRFGSLLNTSPAFTALPLDQAFIWLSVTCLVLTGVFSWATVCGAHERIKYHISSEKK